MGHTCLTGGTIPHGLGVTVKPDGTVYLGNDCIAPQDWLAADAFVRAQPEFQAAVAPRDDEAKARRRKPDAESA